MKKYFVIIMSLVGTVLLIGFMVSVFSFSKSKQESLNNIPSPPSNNPSPTSSLPADITAHIASKSDHIIVEQPQPLTTITSPLTVRGQARGPWYFEASFALLLVDWDGKIIAQSPATALLDSQNPESTWMTEDFVPFTGLIEFENPSFATDFSRRGTLILQKANPSGLSEHDDALEIPLVFAQP